MILLKPNSFLVDTWNTNMNIMQDYYSPVQKLWLAVYNAIYHIYDYFLHRFKILVFLRTVQLVFEKRVHVSVFHPKDSKKRLDSKHGFNVLFHVICNDLD